MAGTLYLRKRSGKGCPSRKWVKCFGFWQMYSLIRKRTKTTHRTPHDHLSSLHSHTQTPHSTVPRAGPSHAPYFAPCLSHLVRRAESLRPRYSLGFTAARACRTLLGLGVPY